jgi:hypothetical protein
MNYCVHHERKIRNKEFWKKCRPRRCWHIQEVLNGQVRFLFSGDKSITPHSTLRGGNTNLSQVFRKDEAEFYSDLSKLQRS